MGSVKILTSEQMRSIDRRAIQQFGIPSIVLMENSALAVTDAVFAHYPETGRVAIFCGPGQNGGDGLAIARHLENRGVIPTIILIGEERFKGDAQTNLEICMRMGLSQRRVRDSDGLDEAMAEASQADLVIDAIFGTGLSRPAEGIYAEAISGMSNLRL